MSNFIFSISKPLINNPNQEINDKIITGAEMKDIVCILLTL
jgi:hypothetical protein